MNLIGGFICRCRKSICYDTENMGFLHNYFDYESFGRDISLDENGAYTSNGYICNNGNSFYEEYDGMNVPDEYRVFAMPRQDFYLAIK